MPRRAVRNPDPLTDNADPATDIVVDNVLWRDIWFAAASDHTDSIVIDYVQGLTIRRLIMVDARTRA